MLASTVRIRLTYAWLYYLLRLFNFDIYLDFGLDTLRKLCKFMCILNDPKYWVFHVFLYFITRKAKIRLPRVDSKKIRKIAENYLLKFPDPQFLFVMFSWHSIEWIILRRNGVVGYFLEFLGLAKNIAIYKIHRGGLKFCWTL